MFPLFFFNDTATTEIYTLSLHDALPICPAHAAGKSVRHAEVAANRTNVNGGASIAKRRAARNHQEFPQRRQDRKSTRLNSSHVRISYAVFCLKKKKNHPSNLGESH